MAIRWISPVIQREKRDIECTIETFIPMVTVSKHRVVLSDLFSHGPGNLRHRTETLNLLVAPVTDGAARDASL